MYRSEGNMRSMSGDPVISRICEWLDVSNIALQHLLILGSDCFVPAYKSQSMSEDEIHIHYFTDIWVQYFSHCFRGCSHGRFQHAFSTQNFHKICVLFVSINSVCFLCRIHADFMLIFQRGKNPHFMRIPCGKTPWNPTCEWPHNVHATFEVTFWLYGWIFNLFK